MITSLQPNEVFVFGSNLAGHHGGGAAKQAHEQFGAQWGVGAGMTGQCYAFPTLDRDLRQLPMRAITANRDHLYEVCHWWPEMRFLLTKVGCGIAGYAEDVMRALFTNPPENLILPEDWRVA